MSALFTHALRLHQRYPDEPLPGDGAPFPDEAEHRRYLPGPEDRGLAGAEVAGILDRNLDDPRYLASAFHDVHVPIHPSEHIGAAAARADPERVRRAGRWLVRHGTDRCAVTVGLALLAAGDHPGDIPLIQTIGLLSERYGPLAAVALARRSGGEEALRWLAQRVAGWGRVYVIEAMCRRGVHTSRDWLLRNACDGDLLNGYFAGKVAIAARLDEAISDPGADDPLVDHTGRLLSTLAICGGMSHTLRDLPAADRIISAHAGHLSRRPPTYLRYVDAAVVADVSPNDIYLELLRRPDWVDAARAGFADDPDYFDWFADNVAARLGLPDLST
ncbi:hypothetical protein GCM10010112_86340 [Actinoplanes lobatus]|uniref:Uncharacterized protein n=1 Tax=Actinoplanes lobatus TaxID=113568 RepID=A0A7W7HII6_9ACTN|nr:hypothetical protein [Actinoplanes lobatus]MBB4751193.1 hypothetical protein [Actinoplanes lobatus]GGN95753.1 hypothetical protein GCM10010112_86340 [Actinoplanes lobatus]GIE44272.1 hypothetical protein Alo02nite_71700 [Actinoplanes lobatus]